MKSEKKSRVTRQMEARQAEDARTAKGNLEPTRNKSRAATAEKGSARATAVDPVTAQRLRPAPKTLASVTGIANLEQISASRAHRGWP